MNKSFISILNDIILYLFSAALALGTINPFSNQIREQNSDSSMTMIFTIIFVSFVLVRFGTRKVSSNLVVPLLLLIIGITIGDLFYDSASTDWFFIFKLSVILLSFVAFVLYFTVNPLMIEASLAVFSVTCVLVIVYVYAVGGSNAMVISKGRLRIFGENSNSTSSRMLFAVLFFVYDIIKNKRNRLIIILELVGTILLTYFIIQSGSRGSLLTVVFGIVLLILFSNIRMGRKITIIAIGAIIIAIALPLILSNENISMFDRLEELEEGNIRTQLMSNAIEIYSYHPWFGVGANGYKVERYIRGFIMLDSHCIITSIMVMGGTFALMGFLAFWMTIFKNSFRIRKNNILPLVFCLSITLIALKTGGVITFVFMWYCYAICYSMSINKPLQVEIR